MIERNLTRHIQKASAQYPAVTLTGPRQSGKSTLCRALFKEHPYVNLEAPDVRQFALEDPRGFLAQYPAGAVLDEIQRCPELPSYLQVFMDADPVPGRWILTGSQNLNLLQSLSQSLAGRTAIFHLLPLTYDEIQRFSSPPDDLDDLLVTGSYPRIYEQKLDPADWLRSYLATYIERDVRHLAQVGDLNLFQRFIELCAGRSSQLLNLSALASDTGVSQPTAKAWVSVLEASFVTLRVPSFSGNLRKRLVKMPKLHFYDTGLLCWLLGIRNRDHLKTHPLRGAIFETWMVSEIIKHRAHRGEMGKVYHYRDQNQVEADLLVETANHLNLMEAKASQTASSALFQGLQKVLKVVADRPSHGYVIYGGTQKQRRDSTTLVPWSSLHELNI